MPQVLLRFLDMAEDDQASLTDLATLVGQDPGLTARFLSVANSPALRRTREIRNLDDCMATLGIRLARTIAECLVIEAGLAHAGGDANEPVAMMWRNSVRVAEMARLLADRTNYGESDHAYLAGLLHDIGQLLLLGGVGERYGGSLRNINDEAKLREVEELLFGTDHAAIGAWLVDQWQLSSFLSDAILFHHKRHDEIVEADRLSKIVWSCQVIDSYSEFLDLPTAVNADLATVMSMLDLEITDIVALRDHSAAHVAALATTLGITEDAAGDGSRQPWQHDRRTALSEVELRVRDLAMMHSLQRNLPTLCREEEILLAVHESARIIFGVGRLAFLFSEGDGSVLSAPDFANQPGLLQQLEIRIEAGRSLAAAAVLGGQPVSTFDRDLTVPVSLADVQLARALDSEGVLYVPMSTGKRHLGVMAYGVSSSQHVRLEKLLTSMTAFARQACASIEACREMRGNEEQMAESLTARFQQQARKVVHEAGNPLSIIKNYLKILGQKLSVENGAGEELDIVREEVDRVVLILQRLGDLTETPPATEYVELNSMINGMLAIYGETLFTAQGISVEKDLAPTLLPTTGDRNSIKQILINLWTNAADVLNSGDRFFISTSDNVIFNGRFYVEICLTDSGPGMPPDVMQRLFKPLDAHRRPGHCGIGLSIVASLVDSLGGLIKCRSNVGAGTSFIILLPRYMESETGVRNA
jgi:HD-like signal output (HDOD) protein/nitrogen-specific signal transduction histidine kinase